MNFFVSRQWVTHQDIVPHGAKEQPRLLAEQLHVATQIGRVQMVKRDIVQQDAALLRLLHARQKLQQRAFAGAISAKHRHALPGTDLQLADVKHAEFLFFIVVKPDVLQHVVAAQMGFMHLLPVLRIVNRSLHQVVQPLTGHFCRLPAGEHA